MIEVVEAISDMNIGGAGRLLLSRIEESNKNNFSYTIILPQGSMLSECFKKIGAKVIEIRGCRNKSFDLKSLWAFYFVLKKIHPDILNSHSCMNARIAGRFAGVTVNLYTRHCDFPINKIHSLKFVKKIVGAITAILNDGIIAVSNSARRNLVDLGVPRSKIKVIINGAQKLRSLSSEEKSIFRSKLNIPKEAVVIGIFARLEPYKDHQTFLRAAKRLSFCKNYYFLIVGNGSCYEKTRKYAKDMGIESRVRFFGFVKDISPIMNITDINVNCSIGTETSSLALSEGMSLGIPAIASDYEGNKYIVKNRENGLLFPQKDDVALAKNILYLTRDKKFYLFLSQNAEKRFYNELNSKRMTRDTEKYYFELLKKRRTVIKNSPLKVLFDQFLRC